MPRRFPNKENALTRSLHRLHRAQSNTIGMLCWLIFLDVENTTGKNGLPGTHCVNENRIGRSICRIDKVYESANGLGFCRLRRIYLLAVLDLMVIIGANKKYLPRLQGKKA